MYKHKHECTMDQELTDAAAAYAPGRRCVCTYQVVALLCAKRRDIESKIDSVNRCVFISRTFRQISSRSDLKRRSIGLF